MDHEPLNLPILPPTEAAQLVARLAHGLLTGPGAVAFIRQSALGQGHDIMAAPLIETAEIMANEIIKRGFKLSAMTYRMAAEDSAELAPTKELRGFFRQAPGTGGPR